MIKKILIFGAGYVGTSLGLLLCKNYKVIFIDNDNKKILKIKNGKLPIDNVSAQNYFYKNKLKLVGSKSYEEHLNAAEFIILALPTNFDYKLSSFDTASIEKILKKFSKYNLKSKIIIKSTIPIGFTEKVKQDFPNLSIIFVPEFLREDRAIEDNLKPTRIIIGDDTEDGVEVASLFRSIAINKPRVLHMKSKEAEAVKLFTNSYLAMRVSFFNELDSFVFENEMNAKDIIDGITLDPRIGNQYNNPSFGFGGYCLPKDTMQLAQTFQNIPQKIFSATLESNRIRKEFIAKKILAKKVNVIGIYRLLAKKDSDNFRDSAVLDIIEILRGAGKKIIIFEPLLKFKDTKYEVTQDLEYFGEISDLIIANRKDGVLKNYADKIFSRDIYGKN